MKKRGRAVDLEVVVGGGGGRMFFFFWHINHVFRLPSVIESLGEGSGR